jgi:hypothetical protein
VNAGTLATTNGGLYIVTATIKSTTSPITLTGNAAASWGFYFGSTSKIQTTTGAITITGNSPDAVWGGYLAAVDVLSASGAIVVDGGGGGLVMGHGATTNIGAISPANSTSDVSIIADSYWTGTTALNVRAAGNVILESEATQFSGALSLVTHTFTGNASLRIGKTTNTKAATIGGSVSIVGNYDVYAGAITQNAPVTTSSATGNITFTGAGAFSNSGALNAGGGLYITGATTLGSTAAWTTNSALDVEASGAISTGSLSPITVNTDW